MTMAVMHALDVGFNGGKANVLEKWTKAIMAEDTPKEEKKPEEAISPNAMAFFSSLPRQQKQE